MNCVCDYIDCRGTKLVLNSTDGVCVCAKITCWLKSITLGIR